MAVTLILNINHKTSQVGSSFLNPTSDEATDTPQPQILNKLPDYKDVRGLIAIPTPVIID